MKPEEYAALYKLEMLGGEELPRIAMKWIEDGVESQALIELAWERSPTLGDAAPLFEAGLRDIGVAVPDKPRALLLLANIYCKQILSGAISPFSGANNIWQRVCMDDDAPEIAYEFVTYADAIQNDGSPKSVEYFNQEIVDAAKRLVAAVHV